MKVKLFLLFLILKTLKSEKILDLNEKIKPPSKTDSSSSIYNIVIMGTNDIHGAYFPKEITYPDLKEKKKKHINQED